MDFAERYRILLQRSAELPDDIPDCVPTLSALCRPRPKEQWSDKLLTQLVTGVNFRGTAYLKTEKPRILKRFFRFYIVGVVDKLDTTVGIINDVIAIASTPMGLIWKPPGKEVEGFYPNNTSEPDSLDSLKRRHTILNFSVEFVNYLHDVIVEIDLGSPETALEKSVIQLATFLALTLYRFATKNATQMENAFKTKQYKNHLTSLVGWPAERPFSPPCEKCLMICEVALAKDTISTSKLFTKVVHKFVLTQKGDYPDPNVAGILAAALLTDTARNGMEMINMLYDVQFITQMTWKVIMGKTCITFTHTSWNNLVTFFLKQTATIYPQYSYHWARIIDHSYFGELAPEKNAFLATVFGSVIAHVHGNGIWEAEWTKQVAIPEDAKFLGRVLYEMSQSLDEAESTFEGAGVMGRARELKHQKLGKTIK